MRSEREHHEQKAVMSWARDQSGEDPRLQLLFAVPNGARVAMRTAVKLKREGLKAGVPDLCLPVAVGSYHGIFIEMKAEIKSAVVSSAQQWWHAALEQQGYCVAVCYGATAGITALKGYLYGPT